MEATVAEPAAQEEVIDADAVEEGEARSEELVQTAPTTAITQRARGQFDKGQMDLIKATVAKDCSPGELAMFLELCARYQLDPFAKQIWAVKMKGRMTIFASRDGLLALANRNPEFEGMDGDVVREHDKFAKIHSADGIEINHTVNEGDIEKRGKIVGAWACVYRTNHRPTYFFAPFTQYNRGGDTPWSKQTDAMILKVAESMALRKAFSISGLVGEDEMRPQLLTRSGAATTPEVEWPEDEELTSQLKQAFEHLGYTRAKVRLKVNGKSPEELRELLDELSAEADAAEAGDAEVVE